MKAGTRRIVRIFTRNRLTAVALGVALALIILSIVGPAIAPHDRGGPKRGRARQPGFWADTSEHRRGTDNPGGDTFSRLLYGAGISLRIGYSVIGVTALIGVTIGLISGYFGGRVDIIVMRIFDVLLAFPPLLLALAIVAVLGTGMENAMMAIVIVYVPAVARIARGSVLSVKELPFIEASRAMGAGNVWIMVGHVLPNILTPVVVYLTLLLGDAILYTAALGFLGIGIDPALPEWGAMLSGGRDFLLVGKWWITVFPGLMIFLAVLSFNLLGDGLREALDPKLRLR